MPSGTTVELEGALRILDSPVAAWPDTTKTPFQAELKKTLDEPWLTTQEDREGRDPEVAPPIYGCWQAARHTVNITALPPATSLTWLDELNLDPRHRAVAALGTQVVQTQQEQFMASAWEQLGEIERINQIRRQAQLGRAVNAVYYTKQFKRFSPETLLKVAASSQARVVVEITDANNFTTRALLSKRISDSALPDRAVSAPLRRLSSPRNAINTRFRTVGVQSVGIVANLNVPVSLLMVQMREAGLIKLDDVAAQAGVQGIRLNDTTRFARATTALNTAPKLGSDFTIVDEGHIRTLPNFARGATVDGKVTAAFRKAAKEFHAYLGEKAGASLLVRPAKAMDLDEIGKSLLRTSILKTPSRIAYRTRSL